MEQTSTAAVCGTFVCLVNVTHTHKATFAIVFIHCKIVKYYFLTHNAPIAVHGWVFYVSQLTKVFVVLIKFVPRPVYFYHIDFICSYLTVWDSTKLPMNIVQFVGIHVVDTMTEGDPIGSIAMSYPKKNNSI